MKLNFFQPKNKKPNKKVTVAKPNKNLQEGQFSLPDILAPEAIELDFSHLKIGDQYLRPLFVTSYPRFVSPNWLSPMINFNHSLDISMFISPVDAKGVLDDLHRKIAEMEAEIGSDIQRGRIASIETQIKLEDAKNIQEQLAKGAERFFHFGLYFSLGEANLESLNSLTKQIQSTLGALLIVAKPASLQTESGFKTTLPFGKDHLKITRNMDTTSLATTFPFTSSELSQDQGILYGLNEHNDSLVIFDRFSLENANLCVLGTSGGGKSYAVKLELIRSHMLNTDVLLIDPENEYQRLTNHLQGQFIDFSFQSDAKINPFDLTLTPTAQETDQLTQKLVSLHNLLKVMLGEINANEEAILDHALVDTYHQKGITTNPATHKNEPPLLEDLYKNLIGAETDDAKTVANRLEKFITGSYQGLFNQHSNVNLDNNFICFGIKNLEGPLRTIGMFLVLDFIWTRIKSKLKKRLLLVDEAWYLMQHQSSANFLRSITKRARKYYLGVTTITQDAEDFLSTEHGKSIITNSALKLLMKQSSAALPKLQEVFFLSQGERNLLLSAEVGEGLFFAGGSHVALKTIASPQEHQIITTKPQEILALQQKQPATSAP